MGGAKKNRCRVVRPASPLGEDPVGAYFSFGERRGRASRLPHCARESAINLIVMDMCIGKKLTFAAIADQLTWLSGDDN